MASKITKDWHIAIFASGTGSNAVKIIEYLQSKYKMRFTVMANKSQAPVLAKAEAMKIPTIVFNRRELHNPDRVLNFLQSKKVDFIILAGFLWLIPEHLVKAYPNKIINIHPSLLPKYGGKGMFGMAVHEAVKEAGDQETGITIHYVDEDYDRGQAILQEKVAVAVSDEPQDIAKKVLELEHHHFPLVVEQLLLGLEG